MFVCRLFLSALLGLSVATPIHAQTAEQRAQCMRDYAPQSGQAGKDVVWVPTPDHLVTAMLEMAGTQASDLVYDLGAGDGKIAIAAAKEFGARAVGVEYNKNMVSLAECLVAAANAADKVRMIHGDIFTIDFSAASVVTLYLLPELNVRLRPTLLKMKPGTRIVSHSFLMGDWTPDNRTLVRSTDYIYLWIVPAQAKGTWVLRARDQGPLTLRLNQQYQEIDGVMIEGGTEHPIRDASLRGEDVTFTYAGSKGSAVFKGKVKPDKLEATISIGENVVDYVGTRAD
jgi:SAM-dependent methyltransferase